MGVPIVERGGSSDSSNPGPRVGQWEAGSDRERLGAAPIIGGQSRQADLGQWAICEIEVTLETDVTEHFFEFPTFS